MSKQNDNKDQADKNQELLALRHSAEHVLTQAMIRLFGAERVIMAMGPATEEGFYFDFDSGADFKLSEEEFERIEKEMRKIIAADLPISRHEVSIAEARELFADNPYKLEWLDQIANRDEKISVYWTGEVDLAKVKTGESFVDLCKGPHVSSTGQIKAFKLLNLAGAYWHGDEKNKMLTRVYGTAFPSQAELDEHLRFLAEAKKRDHRKLGQEQELFMIDDEVGQGLIMWLPRGAFVRHKVMEFAFNTYLESGYQPVVTPHIASSQLWSHSGHLDFYRDSMYDGFGIENEEYRLKPMNCPFHVKMYKHRPRSYKELPLRWTEMGTVYRYEKSGTLHGLMRVRGFTQDDAHIVCTPDQLQQELNSALNLTLYILRHFGFEQFEVNLSTRGEAGADKFIGETDKWQKAEEALKQAMKSAGFDNYVVDEGGAAFYGPKIDLKVTDSIGRKWQLSTIQLDFNLPGRFGMKYVGEDGSEHEPFMIHRALLGSLERFMGVYIEHTGGKFPFWLAPVQVKVLPITDGQHQYAQEVVSQLTKAKLRVELDDRSERLQAKIRDAQLQQIPYMLIVGAKEAANQTVSVRSRDRGDLGGMKLTELVDQLQQ